MALIDALTLSKAITRHNTLRHIFASYTSHRRGHLRWYRWFSHWLTPMFQSEHDWLARCRDLSFQPVAQLPGIRTAMLKILTGTFGLSQD